MISKRHCATQTGFSLIEILISLLVLSIGLLGLGSLQLSALKGTNNAHYRTVASLAVTDLIDRMRSNPLAVENSFYTTTLGVTHCSTALSRVCESGNTCSAKEMAIYDLYRINCGVSSGANQTGGLQYDLPQATLSIACITSPCTAGAKHSVRVSWNEPDNDDADDDVQARSYELSFIP